LKDKAFSQRLKWARLKAGLTQRELSDACGIDRASISKLEGDSGTRNPSYHAIRRLSIALRVSSDFLLGIKLETASMPRQFEELGERDREIVRILIESMKEHKGENAK